MAKTIRHLKIKDGDLNQLCADGASNSINSIAEYEALTRTRRSNTVEIGICLAHQIQRSGGLASGTIDFAEPENEELGEVLNKSHQVQVHLNRAPNRMTEYKKVQEKRQRNPLLNPKPGNDTRWDSKLVETERANLIMGDTCRALQLLFGEGGQDEKFENKDDLTYTEEEKLVLRQFEVAARPATILSKFTQDNRNAWSYVLFYIMHTLQVSERRYFYMHPGMYLLLLLAHAFRVLTSFICLPSQIFHIPQARIIPICGIVVKRPSSSTTLIMFNHVMMIRKNVSSWRCTPLFRRIRKYTGKIWHRVSVSATQSFLPLLPSLLFSTQHLDDSH